MVDTSQSIFFGVERSSGSPPQTTAIHGRTGKDRIKIGNKFNISDLVAETIEV